MIGRLMYSTVLTMAVTLLFHSSSIQMTQLTFKYSILYVTIVLSMTHDVVWQLAVGIIFLEVKSKKRITKAEVDNSIVLE